jgi:hypothetical protein
MNVQEFSHNNEAFHGVFLFDVEQLGLPADWRQQTVALAESRGGFLKLDGSHPSSREEKGQVVSYKQVGGLAIQAELPWLLQAYHGSIYEIAKAAFGKDVIKNDDPRDMGSILMSLPGQRGEIHIDNSAVSVLLYPQPAEIGGRLFISAETEMVGYDNLVHKGVPLPHKAELGIVFPGDSYVHVSERVGGQLERVSVNLNYHLPGKPRDLSIRDYSEPNLG